jgi:hypothetical protein
MMAVFRLFRRDFAVGSTRLALIRDWIPPLKEMGLRTRGGLLLPSPGSTTTWRGGALLSRDNYRSIHGAPPPMESPLEGEDWPILRSPPVPGFPESSHHTSFSLLMTRYTLLGCVCYKSFQHLFGDDSSEHNRFIIYILLFYPFLIQHKE